jgi:hypothetical protein
VCGGLDLNWALDPNLARASGGASDSLGDGDNDPLGSMDALGVLDPTHPRDPTPPSVTDPGVTDPGGGARECRWTLASGGVVEPDSSGEVQGLEAEDDSSSSATGSSVSCVYLPCHAVSSCRLLAAFY